MLVVMYLKQWIRRGRFFTGWEGKKRHGEEKENVGGEENVIRARWNVPFLINYLVKKMCSWINFNSKVVQNNKSKKWNIFSHSRYFTVPKSRSDFLIYSSTHVFNNYHHFPNTLIVSNVHRHTATPLHHPLYFYIYNAKIKNTFQKIEKERRYV